MSLQTRILRAPNDSFYVLWRGQPICSRDSALFCFGNEGAAREFLNQCETGNRPVDLAAFTT
jgi:hypothetical protein